MNKLIDTNVFDYLNKNKYFIGLTMILLNIGARFIIDELDDDFRRTISDKIFRKLFIFCSFFMATKDIITAFILTIFFVIIVNEIINIDDDIPTEEKNEKGGGYNKNELDKTIQKLKSIQANM